MVHRRLVYIYLLNVPSFSSRYFNKIKRTTRSGRLLALSLEILLNSMSERWPIMRWLSHLGENSGDLGLSLRESALLECGKA